MATQSRDGERYTSSEGDVFLIQFEAEATKYDTALSSRTQPTAAPVGHVTRPRIPSVKEVGEKSEGPNWTMSSPAQNLAAALNDPMNREYDLFTRTWGMSFVPTAPLPPSNIPDIQLGDFLRYLKETLAVSQCNINTIILKHLYMCICMTLCRWQVHACTVLVSQDSKDAMRLT